MQNNPPSGQSLKRLRVYESFYHPSSKRTKINFTGIIDAYTAICGLSSDEARRDKANNLFNKIYLIVDGTGRPR